MSYCDVYIGDLDDPNFEMECISDEKWNIGNCPKSISPIFSDGHRAFDELINRIENGQLEGKEVDWGAYVAPVSKKQIIDFIEYLYDEKWQERYTSFPHLLEQLLELKKVVLKLDDRSYMDSPQVNCRYNLYNGFVGKRGYRKESLFKKLSAELLFSDHL